jgi:hypothetical protein
MHLIPAPEHNRIWILALFLLMLSLGCSGSNSSSSNDPTGPSLWQQISHRGALQANVYGPSSAELTWPVEAGVTYNLYVTTDAATLLDTYASYGADLYINVQPPFAVPALSIDTPVYAALEADNDIVSWTSFMPQLPGVRPEVIAVDNDGTRYLGGSFSRVEFHTGGAAILPAVGEGPDHRLALPAAEAAIRVAQSDGLGGWYVGGEFTRIGDTARNNLAHIDAAGQVTAWNPGVDNPVSAMTVSDGIIYVAGGFTTAESGGMEVARGGLAAFNELGQLLPWNPTIEGYIHALAVHNGVVFVGGEFYQANGQARENLVVFDAEGDLLENWSVPNGTVSTLLVANGKLYAGGYFTMVGATERRYLAAFSLDDGTLGGWDPQPDQAVRALTHADGLIYVGGGFTTIRDGDEVLARSRIAVYNLNHELTPWEVDLDDWVQTICVAGEVVYVGGVFHVADGAENRHSLAAFASDGTLLDWNPGATRYNWVHSIVPGNGVVLITGAGNAAGWATSGNLVRNYLAAFDAQGNLTRWNPGANNAVSALLIDGDLIYAGGSFTEAGGESRLRLAAFDKQGNLADWDAEVDDGSVSSMAMFNDLIHIGGSFTSAGGAPRTRIAAFERNGILSDWAPNIPGEHRVVRSMLVHQEVLYIGGNFTQVAGQTRRTLAAFNSSGTLTAWNGSTSDAVSSLAADGALIFAGGNFNDWGQADDLSMVGQRNMAAFDLSGQPAAWIGFPASSVASVVAVDGVVYAGGYFSEVDQEGVMVPSDRMAAFDYTGRLVPWAPSQGGSITALATHQGLIYIGGYVNSFGEGSSTVRRLGYAVLDADGNLLQ